MFLTSIVVISVITVITILLLLPIIARTIIRIIIVVTTAIVVSIVVAIVVVNVMMIASRAKVFAFQGYRVEGLFRVWGLGFIGFRGSVFWILGVYEEFRVQGFSFFFFFLGGVAGLEFKDTYTYMFIPGYLNNYGFGGHVFPKP